MQNAVRPRVILVEDNPDIVEVVTYNLSREGFDVESLSSGKGAVETIQAQCPALVLLDLMLPGKDGLTICRQLRQVAATAQIPIIMVTARGEKEEIVAGLELGADDYVVKPFSPKELMARVRAVLRRTDKQVGQSLEIGELVVDVERYEVRLRGKVLSLTRTEFLTLQALLANRGRIFTRDQLINKVRGEDVVIVDRNVDVHISSLRKKLEDYGSRIVTVRGVGYRFAD